MPSDERFDVVVYGGTPAGVIASVTAARRGARVVLLENTRHVGGLSTSGLNTSEYEHMLPDSWGGCQLEFYQRLGKRYGIDGPLHAWESRVAESVFSEMLDEAGVAVEFDAWIADASTAGGRIVSITMTDGRELAGGGFIDCSYEGDLAHHAGVTMTFGRESREHYGESLAGQRFVEDLGEVANTAGHSLDTDRVVAARTVDASGNLLPYFTPADAITPGAADARVMNYNFRVTASTSADRVPFTAPDGYDPDDFALIVEWLASAAFAGEPRLADVIDIYPFPSGRYREQPGGVARPIPTDKWELNNKQSAVVSLGHFGGQFDWPDGTHDRRRAIWRDHKRHNLGLLYFLANDPAVPRPLREDANRFGLAADEYVDHDHWPYHLYVREGRRMVGDFVMTQHDVLTDTRKDDVVMRGSHWIDSHHVQRVAIDAGHFRNEGRIWRQVHEAYDLPYRCLLPRGAECTNLLVPVAVSASRVAYCSIRLESVWMLLGQVAGEAATMAMGDDRAVQEIDVPALQQRLIAAGVQLGR